MSRSDAALLRALASLARHQPTTKHATHLAERAEAMARRLDREPDLARIATSCVWGGIRMMEDPAMPAGSVLLTTDRSAVLLTNLETT